MRADLALNSRLEYWQSKVAGQLDMRVCNGCDCCGTRCADGVPMTRAEYTAVETYVNEPANSVRVKNVEVQNKALPLGDNIEVQMCRFRDMDNRQCAIYPVRPTMCRLMGYVEWMPCPIDKVTTTAATPDALELMRAYAAETRYTYEEWAK